MGVKGPEPEPDVQRERDWIVLTRRMHMSPVRRFLREGPAPHVVHMPTELLNRLGMAQRVWLTERFGPPMIWSSNYGMNPYWTSGCWVSIVTEMSKPGDGRDYYFQRANDAFEFKMRWR